MPTKEIIPSVSVAETQMLPHLRNKKRRSSNTTNISQSQEYILLTAGESLGEGKAVAIGSDGKAYLSELDSTLRLPCMAVTIESGAIDQIVRCKMAGVYYDPSAAYAIGRDLFLNDSGVISTSAPTYTAGNYLQFLGKALSANTGMLTIDQEMVCL